MTDMLMPIMNGSDFLKSLKEQRIKIPAVVLSADIQQSTRDECKRLGAAIFLNKPVDGAALRDAIDQCIPSKDREKV